MGRLHYGQLEVAFDDRTLIHLQIAIGSKLRRGEGFFLSWIGAEDGHDARRSIWLGPTVPLGFTLESVRTGPINRRWLHDMDLHGSTESGLRVMPEPVLERVPERAGSR
ncbi:MULTISPECIES: ATP-dependent DNA ligase [unclassified Frondihabitans]|uniref:DUF7882 family protein n=1 Tax=unclassified Frondihabitans TaxID=2626248 RepID=UPI000F4FE77E|nr:MULTISPECIES: ATP-dependent DNA ligase [unclassified Frondihabitans]RPE77818.1 hypothetical protein EDF37_0480 [Frondihabitans sp. PhB153]RPF08097.1 hypothetical protein EDF39_0481 [Frondihabitans sp. PhB161]